MFRPLGQNYATARVTVFHESGESIFSEVGFSTEFKNARSQEQALGSAKTYYHKYMLSGLYGLANDDDDDGEATVSTQAKTQSKAPAKKPAPVATPIIVSEPQQPAPNADGLSADEHALCLAIIKDPDKGADAKKQFMAKFYPSAVKLTAPMIKHKDHLTFLDAIHTGIPF